MNEKQFAQHQSMLQTLTTQQKYPEDIIKTIVEIQQTQNAIKMIDTAVETQQQRIMKHDDDERKSKLVMDSSSNYNHVNDSSSNYNHVNHTLKKVEILKSYKSAQHSNSDETIQIREKVMAENHRLRRSIALLKQEMQNYRDQEQKIIEILRESKDKMEKYKEKIKAKNIKIEQYSDVNKHLKKTLSSLEEKYEHMRSYSTYQESQVSHYKKELHQLSAGKNSEGNQISQDQVMDLTIKINKLQEMLRTYEEEIASIKNKSLISIPDQGHQLKSYRSNEQAEENQGSGTNCNHIIHVHSRNQLQQDPNHETRPFSSESLIHQNEQTLKQQDRQTLMQEDGQTLMQHRTELERVSIDSFKLLEMKEIPQLQQKEYNHAEIQRLEEQSHYYKQKVCQLESQIHISAEKMQRIEFQQTEAEKEYRKQITSLSEQIDSHVKEQQQMNYELKERQQYILSLEHKIMENEEKLGLNRLNESPEKEKSAYIGELEADLAKITSDLMVREEQIYSLTEKYKETYLCLEKHKEDHLALVQDLEEKYQKHLHQHQKHIHQHQSQIEQLVSNNDLLSKKEEELYHKLVEAENFIEELQDQNKQAQTIFADRKQMIDQLTNLEQNQHSYRDQIEQLHLQLQSSTKENQEFKEEIINLTNILHQQQQKNQAQTIKMKGENKVKQVNEQQDEYEYDSEKEVEDLLKVVKKHNINIKPHEEQALNEEEISKNYEESNISNNNESKAEKQPFEEDRLYVEIQIYQKVEELRAKLGQELEMARRYILELERQKESSFQEMEKYGNEIRSLQIVVKSLHSHKTHQDQQNQDKNLTILERSESSENSEKQYRRKDQVQDATQLQTQNPQSSKHVQHFIQENKVKTISVIQQSLIEPAHDGNNLLQQEQDKSKTLQFYVQKTQELQRMVKDQVEQIFSQKAQIQSLVSKRAEQSLVLKRAEQTQMVDMNMNDKMSGNRWQEQLGEAKKMYEEEKAMKEKLIMINEQCQLKEVEREKLVVLQREEIAERNQGIEQKQREIISITEEYQQQFIIQKQEANAQREAIHLQKQEIDHHQQEIDHHKQEIDHHKQTILDYSQSIETLTNNLQILNKELQTSKLILSNAEEENIQLNFKISKLEKQLGEFIYEAEEKTKHFNQSSLKFQSILHEKEEIEKKQEKSREHTKYLETCLKEEETKYQVIIQRLSNEVQELKIQKQNIQLKYETCAQKLIQKDEQITRLTESNNENAVTLKNQAQNYKEMYEKQIEEIKKQDYKIIEDLKIKYEEQIQQKQSNFKLEREKLQISNEARKKQQFVEKIQEIQKFHNIYVSEMINKYADQIKDLKGQSEELRFLNKELEAENQRIQLNVNSHLQESMRNKKISNEEEVKMNMYVEEIEIMKAEIEGYKVENNSLYKQMAEAEKHGSKLVHSVKKQPASNQNHKIVQLEQQITDLNELIQNFREDNMQKVGKILEYEDMIQKLKIENEDLKLVKSHQFRSEGDSYEEELTKAFQYINSLEIINQKLKEKEEISTLEKSKLQKEIKSSRRNSEENLMKRSKVFNDEKLQNVLNELEDCKMKLESAEAYIVQLEDECHKPHDNSMSLSKSNNNTTMKLKLAEADKLIETKEQELQGLRCQLEEAEAYIKLISSKEETECMVGNQALEQEQFNAKTCMNQKQSICQSSNSSLPHNLHEDSFKDKIELLTEFVQNYSKAQLNEKKAEQIRHKLENQSLRDLFSTICYKLEKDSNLEGVERSHANGLGERMRSIEVENLALRKKSSYYEIIERKNNEYEGQLKNSFIEKIKLQEEKANLLLKIAQYERNCYDHSEEINSSAHQHNQSKGSSSDRKHIPQKEKQHLILEAEEKEESDSMMPEEMDSEIPSSLNVSKEIKRVPPGKAKLKHSTSLFSSQKLKEKNHVQEFGKSYKLFLYKVVQQMNEIQKKMEEFELQLKGIERKAKTVIEGELSSKQLKNQILLEKIQQIEKKMLSNQQEMKRYLYKFEKQLIALIRELLGQEEPTKCKGAISIQKIEENLTLMEQEMLKNNRLHLDEIRRLREPSSKHSIMIRNKIQNERLRKLSLNEIKEDINQDKISEMAIRSSLSEKSHQIADEEADLHIEFKSKYLETLDLFQIATKELQTMQKRIQTMQQKIQNMREGIQTMQGTQQKHHQEYFRLVNQIILSNFSSNEKKPNNQNVENLLQELKKTIENNLEGHGKMPSQNLIEGVEQMLQIHKEIDELKSSSKSDNNLKIRVTTETQTPAREDQEKQKQVLKAVPIYIIQYTIETLNLHEINVIYQKAKQVLHKNIQESKEFLNKNAGSLKDLLIENKPEVKEYVEENLQDIMVKLSKSMTSKNLKNTLKMSSKAESYRILAEVLNQDQQIQENDEIGEEGKGGRRLSLFNSISDHKMLEIENQIYSAPTKLSHQITVKLLEIMNQTERLNLEKLIKDLFGIIHAYESEMDQKYEFFNLQSVNNSMKMKELLNKKVSQIDLGSIHKFDKYELKDKNFTLSVSREEQSRNASLSAKDSSNQLNQ